MRLLRRHSLSLSVLFTTCAVLALVALSPWALKGLVSARGMNWTELSNVGQAYSAAAALVSSLALAGVIASLLTQSREARVAREQAVRSLHNDLVRMGMDDSLLRVVSGSRDLPSPASELRVKQRRYANLWVQYWSSMYELGLLPEQALRRELRESLFSGDVGRDYWLRARGDFTPPTSPRGHRYYKIVNSEFEKAVAAGPPQIVRAQVPPIRARIPGNRPVNTSQAGVIGLSMLGAAAIGAVVTRALTR